MVWNRNLLIEVPYLREYKLPLPLQISSSINGGCGLYRKCDIRLINSNSGRGLKCMELFWRGTIELCVYGYYGYDHQKEAYVPLYYLLAAGYFFRWTERNVRKFSATRLQRCNFHVRSSTTWLACVWCNNFYFHMNIYYVTVSIYKGCNLIRRNSSSPSPPLSSLSRKRLDLPLLCYPRRRSF